MLPRAPPRRTLRRAPRALLALLLLLAAPVAVLPPAEAQGAAPISLEYTVRLDDPTLIAQGKVSVTWKASGFKDRISAFCLQTDRHEYPISDFGPLAPGGAWESHPQDPGDAAGGKPECKPGFRAVLSNNANEVSASYTLDVKRPAFTACGCEFNSYLGSEWGVIKGESLAIPFSYAFFAPQPTFRAQVRFQLPPDWSAEAPWIRLAANHYQLPGEGAPLPRGFFVAGKFTPELQQGAGGKEFVYVRLAAELRTKDSLFEYLSKATPYYQGVYGNVTGQRILVVSAGPPMFTGGLGSTDSLFVHQNSSAETIAHEYAHVWQRFQTVDTQGISSIWTNEGDADLHGALSRFVTETQGGFTLAKLNQEFKESYDKHSVDPKFMQPLPVAAYGQEYEQVAYKKGLAVLVFMDAEVKRITNNAAGLNDVLRELNRYYDAEVGNRSGEKRMTNEDVLKVVNSVVQRHANVDMKGFFDRYVFAGEWPPYREVTSEAPVVFDKLQLSTAALEEGAVLEATVQVTNVRSAPVTRPVEIHIDDKLAQQRNVTIQALQTVPVSFQVRAPGPGQHTARVAYLREDFRVLTPADLSIERAAPGRAPQEGVAFDLDVVLRNAGESPARATVSVTIGGAERTAEVQVAGGGVGNATLTFLVPQQGAQTAQVRATWGNRTATRDAPFVVGPRDRDNDGVPDAKDAFPDDPKLSEPGVVNDLRSKAPGFEGVAALAAMAVALLVARRRR